MKHDLIAKYNQTAENYKKAIYLIEKDLQRKVIKSNIYLRNETGTAEVTIDLTRNGLNALRKEYIKDYNESVKKLKELTK